jgi:hypothetical protein
MEGSSDGGGGVSPAATAGRRARLRALCWATELGLRASNERAGRRAGRELLETGSRPAMAVGLCVAI